MTKRRRIGANALVDNGGGEDKLARLVRTIAREAAWETFRAFQEALQTLTEQPVTLPYAPDASARGTERPNHAEPSPQQGERLFGVPAVAERLEYSTKTVRRMIERDELPAIWVGNQLRVRERDLAAYVARARRRGRRRK
jgi:excisionase family DNA binding protein